MVGLRTGAGGAAGARQMQKTCNWAACQQKRVWVRSADERGVVVVVVLARPLGSG
jgi:hypothetical protein